MARKCSGGRVLGTVLLAVGFTMGLVACSGSGAASDAADNGALRTIKTSPNLTQIPLLYALEENLFGTEGLTLQEGPDATTSTAPIQALLAGQADMVMIGTNAIVSGISAGQKLVAVGLFAPATGFQVVLSKKVTERLAASGVTSKSPIKERVQAMKGLVIASNGPGNAVDSILRATLTEYGVAPDGDLTLRAIPDPGAMSAAFREGKVDGFIFGLPFTTQPVVAGVGEVWINYIEGDVPSLADAPSGIVVTTRDFAAKHEDELVKFNTALAKAYQAVYATPDKVKEKLRGMAAFAKLDPKLFDAAFDAAVPIFDNGPIATEREFQQMIRIYNSDASITKKSDASFDQVFDISFAQKAAGK